MRVIIQTPNGIKWLVRMDDNKLSMRLKKFGKGQVIGVRK